MMILTILFSLSAFANLNIATTTPDLEAVVKSVGGDKVQVFSIAKGTQDPHQVEAKPSFMVKLRDADLIISQGLQLEAAWLEPLIRGARNPKIIASATGYLELGEQLDPIEVAKGNVSRAEGDVHPEGNPHFQLDPVRLGKSAVIIAQKLSDLDSSNGSFYKSNAEKFQKRMEEKNKEWKSRIEKTGIKEVVTYHKTFSYFLDRFGIKSSLQLEPKPGIPPTASHLIEVIDQMKRRNIKLVLIENFFDASMRDKLKTEVPGVKIAMVPVYVGGEPNIKTNEELIENLVRVFEVK